MAEAPKAKPAPAAEAPAAAASSGISGWLPVIVVCVAVPVLSIVTAKFFIFPGIEKHVAAAMAGAGAEGPAHHAPATAAHEGEKGDGKKEGEPAQSYEFKDIVSNLAGAMKSRYIKVTFTAYGSDPKFKETIEANKARLLDTTLGVLGSLNLAEMEDASIKNKVRISLVQAYQTVLKSRVIEEVYFSEFVVQ
jgi:flagellar basal body-associated protein FliL